MKNILIWGSISSQWTLNFINNFLLEDDYEIWIPESRVTDTYRMLVSLEHVHIIEEDPYVAEWLRNGSKGTILKKIRMYLLQARNAAKYEKYDIVNLHYVEFVNLVQAYSIMRIQKNRLVLSYWGSDLLRCSKKILFLMRMFVNEASFVSFDNNDLMNSFCSNNPKFPGRKEMIMFGLPILRDIEVTLAKDSKEQLRLKWKVPLDVKVVAVGYSNIPEQQHLQVLSQIARLDDVIKKDMFLLLQMTYGGTAAYRDSVKLRLEQIGIPYLILEEFLTDTEVAELRVITDIYINAQTTDAFSGSVCENLYSGSELINAKWLRYQEFDQYDFSFYEFDSFEQINECLIKAMNTSRDLSNNKQLISKLRSWDALFARWKEAYDGVFSL